MSFVSMKIMEMTWFTSLLHVWLLALCATEKGLAAPEYSSLVNKALQAARCRTQGTSVWKIRTTTGEAQVQVVPKIASFSTKFDTLPVKLNTNMAFNWMRSPGDKNGNTSSALWKTGTEIILSAEPNLGLVDPNILPFAALMWRFDLQESLKTRRLQDLSKIPKEMHLIFQILGIKLYTMYYMTSKPFAVVDVEFPKVLSRLRSRVTMVFDIKDPERLQDLMPQRTFMTVLLELPATAYGITSYGLEFEPAMGKVLGFQCSKIIVETMSTENHDDHS